MRKREKEPQPISKPFEEMNGQERINHILSGLPPGTVYADNPEASAEDARKLRWQLTPAEKKIVDFVMDHQADEFRNMTPEQLAKKSERIRKLLGIEAVTSADPGFIEFE